ncbi:MAG: aminotransferase class I/II-fold pyridoxal phosphate-dependent enzyme [bacterium]|nr:aminotransferase class I/II-fold pyridoxal phosphate-dependent enzyme [bacterium]
MSPRLPLSDIVQNLPTSVPFVGPETLERRHGRPLQVRIGANESVFGVSPVAAAAMSDTINKLWMYNDPEAYELKKALAAHHGIAAQRLHVGAGIDEILGDVVRIFANPGDRVVTSLGSYPTFNYHVHGYGAALVEVAYVDDHTHLAGLAQAAHDADARMVYLANPDNPMGTWHNGADVAGLLAELPEDCMLILDEAYADFAPSAAIAPMEIADPRLIRTRTFSKAHGMAGARIGYAMAHEQVVAALNKVCNQFGVNRLAQVGALASLGDTGFIANVVQQVEGGRREYALLAKDLGLGHIDSATNFLNFDLGSGERARTALAGLLARDVFIRMPGKPPGDRCIRVTVGTPSQRATFADAFRATLATLPT